MSSGEVPPHARRVNKRTREFHRLFDALPPQVRRVARAKFVLFVADPSHPSLDHRPLHDAELIETESFRVRVTMSYRAIYRVVDAGTVNLWYWCGSHGDYNRLVGKGG